MAIMDRRQATALTAPVVQRGFLVIGVGLAAGFELPVCVLVAAPLPVLLPPVFDVFVRLFPAGFAPPAVVVPLPPLFVAGVVTGVDVGKEVIGVGGSGIGFDTTLATNSVTLASVASLLRYL